MKGSFVGDLVCRTEEAAFLADHIAGESDWFHQFSFSNGLRTPGRDPSLQKLHHLCLPASLAGLSVVDIGAYEGFFSFHCEARGAARVVAADRFVWNWPGSSARRNFNAVHRAIGSRVEALDASVEGLPAAVSETFDVTLFLGVLYHAPNIVQYLEAVAAVTSGVLVLETFADALHEAGPRIVAYDEGELNNDATNWFGPNLQAIDILLRRVGFKRIELMNFWHVNTREQLGGLSPFQRMTNGRLVLHAYK